MSINGAGADTDQYQDRLEVIHTLARDLVEDVQTDDLPEPDRRSANRHLREIIASVGSAQIVLVGPDAVFDGWSASDTNLNTASSTDTAEGDDTTQIPVTDGGQQLPKTFTMFARGQSTCEECGDRVRDRFLVDGVCVGCLHRVTTTNGYGRTSADSGPLE